MENKQFEERVDEALNLLKVCDGSEFDNEQFAKHQLESMLRGEQMTKSLALQICDKVFAGLRNKITINNHSQ